MIKRSSQEKGSKDKTGKIADGVDIELMND
jgi:hypothetical protein